MREWTRAELAALLRGPLDRVMGARGELASRGASEPDGDVLDVASPVSAAPLRVRDGVRTLESSVREASPEEQPRRAATERMASSTETRGAVGQIAPMTRRSGAPLRTDVGSLGDAERAAGSRRPRPLLRIRPRSNPNRRVEVEAAERPALARGVSTGTTPDVVEPESESAVIDSRGLRAPARSTAATSVDQLARSGAATAERLESRPAPPRFPGASGRALESFPSIATGPTAHEPAAQRAGGAGEIPRTPAARRWGGTRERSRIPAASTMGAQEALSASPRLDASLEGRSGFNGVGSLLGALDDTPRARAGSSLHDTHESGRAEPTGTARAPELSEQEVATAMRACARRHGLEV